MAMLDTVGWKAFRLGDLFNIVRGTSRTMRMLDEGDIPVIAAARADQGVAGCYDVKPEYQDAITISCNGVGCGSVFYHDGPFVITGDASVMQEKQKMSRAIKLFIAAVCDSLFSVKYSYAEKCNPVGLAKEMIFLPATPDGQPDWAYMDVYMGEVLKKEEVFAEHLASLTAEAVVDGHPLDTSSWKAFRIGELFEIRPTKAYKLTNSDLLNVNGNIPVVANSAQNNGVVGFSNLEATEKGGIITFSDTTDANAIFYQSRDFIGYAHVQGMYRKFEKVSDVVMLFLATAFQSQALKMNFDYANKFRRDIALNIEISLPVTTDGTPDWAWMEQYMQRQMDKAAALVEHLDAVWS